jgi:hypothetical protein
MAKPNSTWNLTQLKHYVRERRLNKPEIRLTMRKGELVAGLKKHGHWEEGKKVAPAKKVAPKKVAPAKKAAPKKKETLYEKNMRQSKELEAKRGKPKLRTGHTQPPAPAKKKAAPAKKAGPKKKSRMDKIKRLLGERKKLEDKGLMWSVMEGKGQIKALTKKIGEEMEEELSDRGVLMTGSERHMFHSEFMPRLGMKLNADNLEHYLSGYMKDYKTGMGARYPTSPKRVRPVMKMPWEK